MHSAGEIVNKVLSLVGDGKSPCQWNALLANYR